MCLYARGRLPHRLSLVHASFSWSDDVRAHCTWIADRESSLLESAVDISESEEKAFSVEHCGDAEASPTPVNGRRLPIYYVEGKRGHNPYYLLSIDVTGGSLVG